MNLLWTYVLTFFLIITIYNTKRVSLGFWVFFSSPFGVIYNVVLFKVGYLVLSPVIREKCYVLDTVSDHAQSIVLIVTSPHDKVQLFWVYILLF